MLHRINRNNSSSNKYVIFSVIALMVFGVTLLFYGCQFFQPKSAPAVSDEAPQDRRIGVLKSLGGIRTSNQGTHLLQMDNGDTILLKSLQINLDDEKYLDKTVEVSGVLTFTTDQKQIMEVMSIDVLSELSTQASQEVSWKNYSSQVMGITLKYKDDLKVDESIPGEVSFQREFTPSNTANPDTEQSQQSSSEAMVSGPVTHQISFSVADTTYSTLFGYLKSLYPEIKSESGSDLLTAGISRSKIGADSLDAFKKVDTQEGKTRVNYYLMAGSKVITVLMETGNDERTLDDQNLFYDMLSSLKIEGSSSPAATSQTVTSEPVTIEPDQGNNPAISDADVAPVTPKKTTVTTTKTMTQESTAADINFVPPATLPTVPAEKTVPATSQVVTQGTADAENAGGTQATLPGYSLMESTGLKFSMQVPKSWFYSGTTSSEAGVIRHYDFGTKPLDEQPGIASMDITTGALPAGNPTPINNKPVVTVSNGDSVTVYAKGSGSRIYKFTGPSSLENSLLQMAATLQD